MRTTSQKTPMSEQTPNKKEDIPALIINLDEKLSRTATLGEALARLCVQAPPVVMYLPILRGTVLPATAL